MKTKGISPKVSIPTLLLIVVGLVLFATGDKETGTTLLLAALGVGATGVAAPPADVVFPSDEADPLEGNVPGGGPDVAPQ